MQFDHERLDVYRVAIEFVAWTDELLDRLPAGRRGSAVGGVARQRPAGVEGGEGQEARGSARKDQLCGQGEHQGARAAGAAALVRRSVLDQNETYDEVPLLICSLESARISPPAA